MADVKPITSVSVKSLDITDPGLKQRLEQIAKSGGDLDTPEELKAAADLLEQVVKQAQRNLSKTQLALYLMQIGRDRSQAGTSVRVVEAGIPYEYTIKNSPFRKDWLGLKDVYYPAYLERRNLITNEIVKIQQGLYGCAKGENHIEQLATDGNNVFVVFENQSDYFGKIVGTVIQFAKIETDWKVGDFVVQGGKLFMDTVNTTLESPSHSLVSAAVLPFKEFSDMWGSCRGVW